MRLEEYAALIAVGVIEIDCDCTMGKNGGAFKKEQCGSTIELAGRTAYCCKGIGHEGEHKACVYRDWGRDVSML